MDTYILPFWKKIGTSSSIIARRVSEKLNLPTSHTGTLDPLAEGVVKIIVGEESRNKEKFISEDKTYHFKFLFGVSTDTHDALGLITDFSDKRLDLKDLEEDIILAINKFKGKYHQKYPNFSSKKIQGKSLWQYEREGLPVPEVFIDGEVKEVRDINFGKISSTDFLEKVQNQINQVHGNFRQIEIINLYDSKLNNKLFELIYCEITVVMTRGLYVRGLARDLSEKINLPCIILDLIRIQDGETKKEDCLIPEEYFEEEILKNQNFLYPDFKNL